MFLKGRDQVFIIPGSPGEGPLWACRDPVPGVGMGRVLAWGWLSQGRSDPVLPGDAPSVLFHQAEWFLLTIPPCYRQEGHAARGGWSFWPVSNAKGNWKRV